MSENAEELKEGLCPEKKKKKTQIPDSSILRTTSNKYYELITERCTYYYNIAFSLQSIGSQVHQDY